MTTERYRTTLIITSLGISIYDVSYIRSPIFVDGIRFASPVILQLHALDFAHTARLSLQLNGLFVKFRLWRFMASMFSIRVQYIHCLFFDLQSPSVYVENDISHHTECFSFLFFFLFCFLEPLKQKYDTRKITVSGDAR